MRDIDFLPVQYRERHARREGTQRSVLVAGLFAGMLVAAGMAQGYVRRLAQRELADVAPQYEAAQRAAVQLAELQTKLQAVRATAQLHTYLQHPWPRTQLLAGLTQALPPNVALREMRIARDVARDGGSAGRQSQAEKEAQQQQLAKLTPAGRDLKSLRDTYDKSPVVIELSGTTTDDSALHRYLAALRKNDLFATVDLISSENKPGEHGAEPPHAEHARLAGRDAHCRPAEPDAQIRFHARLVVLPGYGQPDGPAGKAAAQDVKTLGQAAASTPATGPRGAHP